MRINRSFFLVALSLAVLWAAGFGQACPMCEAIGTQTLSEQIEEADVAVIVKLASISAPQEDPTPARKLVPQATFHIDQIIKASPEHNQQMVRLSFSREAKPGSLFLLTGVRTDDDEKIQWASPIRLTTRSRSYVKRLPSLPKQGPQRLAFHQAFLEDEEELLASDSYDEFARAPYAHIKAFKDKINRRQLVSWIQSPEMPATRKRLYLMMLSVCGTDAEIPLLERLLRQRNRKAKAGFDSIIACYLTLTGPRGLEMVDDLFLHNTSAAYVDTYATIMALRFHASETDAIPRERILASLRLVLNRPQMADLVIPDLARWQDWSAMDRLVTMFKNVDSSSSWPRIPIINYLRACPLPEAKMHLAELKELAPNAFDQADALFPALQTSDKQVTTSNNQKE